MKKKVELIKPKNPIVRAKERKTQVTILASKIMPVGGAEGPKKLILINVPQGENENKSKNDYPLRYK